MVVLRLVGFRRSNFQIAVFQDSLSWYWKWRSLTLTFMVIWPFRPRIPRNPIQCHCCILVYVGQVVLHVSMCFCHFSVKNAFDSIWKDKYPVYVFANGIVFWNFKGQFQTSCDFNMYHFPFDTQVCYIIFGNIADYDNTINVTSTYDHVDFTFFIDNKEFRYDYITQFIT